MPAPLLSMSGVSKSFGPTLALDNVDLEAQRGEVLALVGENGAGKSTLMKVLSGALRPDAGDMLLDNAPYHPRGPQDAREAGVAMIYQELNIAPDLAVEDNVLLGQELHRGGMLRRSVGRQRVRQALQRLGHDDIDARAPAGGLSVGQQQLVEIARSLLIHAKVFVFDEPTSSLTQQDVEKLFDVIRRLKSEGLAIIYISHFLEEIRQIADRYAVLRDGRLTGTGRLNDVTDEDIVALMVGRSVDQLFPRVPHEPGDVLLEIDRLSGSPIPQDVSFHLRRGEILGIAGLVGAGRSELLRAIYGLDAVTSGQVRVAKVTVPGSTPARIRAGFGLVSEDRKDEGLAQGLSVTDNLTLSRLGSYSRWGWMSLRKRRAAVDRWIERLQVKLHSPNQAVQSLSGGNQQKVAIARVLHQEADLLLLDEPTRGIDVGTKAEIYRLMGELAAAGKSVVFVSSYLPELLAICDRIAVMARGRLRDLRDAQQWSEDSVMACAVDLPG